MSGRTRRLRVLTWHIHGSYLEALTHVPHELYLPVKPGRPEGYAGRSPGRPWPDSVHEVGAEDVRRLAVDCVLLQSRRNWEVDQHELLSGAQRRIPRIYLEHDPPRQQPTDTRHPVDDPDVLLVHVTHFNALMWDSGRTPTRVVEHGVAEPAAVRWNGRTRRGIVVVNQLARRGRRLGADVFTRTRDQVPLDLVGMESEQLGGLGDIPYHRLPSVEAEYRFFFNPIRYTSLGLAVIEAMLLGLPVVGLATTEMATVIDDGVTGFVDTNLERLVERMRALLDDHGLAARVGEAGRQAARTRFSIERFARDWDDAFRLVTA